MGNLFRARGPGLGRVWLAALLVACSGDPSPAGSLVLGIHTNDLLIAEDVNLIGLYVDHLDAQGRSLERMAYEVAPIRTGDVMHVPLPSTLVLASSGVQGEKVHARLVAYRKDTREVLTMREARALVPTDRNQLLRLNLFFTNQNNVIDASPGVPVLASDVTLQDQQGPISADAFARFSSRCDGRAAGAEETADDSGHCAPLEVTLGEADAYDEEKGTRGSQKGSSCYDVAQTFAKRSEADDAVRRIDRSVLPETGACTIQLPGTYDVTRLNVAMLTSEAAFETPSWNGAKLRPLAAGVAFTPQQNVITLSASQCDVVRRSPVQGLLVSQRTTAWAGADPVCAPWNQAANQPGTFDGPPPGPAVVTPDAGTDADASPEDEALANRSLGLIAVSGPGTMSLVADGSEAALAWAAASALDVATFRYDDDAVLAPFDLPGAVTDRLHAVKFGNELEYFVHERMQGIVKHVTTDGNGRATGFEVVEVALEDGGREPALGILGADVSKNFARTERGLHPMTGPASALSTTEGILPPLAFDSAWPARALSSGIGIGLIVGDNSAVAFGVDPIGSERSISLSPPPTRGDDLVGVGSHFFGTVSDGSIASVVRYFIDTTITPEPVSGLDGVERLAGTEGHLCYTQAAGDRTLGCFPVDQGGLLGAVTKPLPGTFYDLAIAADPLYLHVVYACTAGQEYRAVKIPWRYVDVPDRNEPKLAGCPAP